MKRLFAAASAAALLLSPMPTLAHEHGEEAEVLAVVDAFMAGLEAKDPEAMNAQVMEDGYLALVRPREGGDRTQSMRLTQASDGIASAPGDIAEPTWDEVVMVDGPVAMVWAPYAFLMDGERTHCGVDIFTLMRVDGTWKIATVTYSHITDACPDMPE